MSRTHEKTSWDTWLVFLLLVATLAFAPLIRGGNRQLALSGLLALALVMLAVLLAGGMARVFSRASTSAEGFAVLKQPAWWWALILLVVSAPLWLAIVQLWPLPVRWWAALPGRAEYEHIAQVAGVVLPSRLPLSLNPGATWPAIWSTLPVVAVFVAALSLPRAHIDRLLFVLLLAGLLQVLVAVGQFALGSSNALYFGRTGAGFIGTFANRNHLADFLAMLVPVWFYGWFGLRSGAGDERHHHRLTGYQAMRRPLWLLLGFSFLLVVLSTQSRGGIFATVLVLVLATLFYGRVVWVEQLKPWQRWFFALTAVVLAALALASIDASGLLGRVEGLRLQSDAQLRATIASATWDAAGTFWPWGSGAGTFESVFPRFQPEWVRGYVNHAHNDYAQWLMELGLPGLLLAGALLFLTMRQLAQLLPHVLGRHRQGPATAELALRCFAGLGVLALLLHSWVEFNLHIPALAIAAGFLMGVFLRPLLPARRHRGSNGRGVGEG